MRTREDYYALYAAASLEGLLSRGHPVDAAVELARDAARKMTAATLDDVDSDAWEVGARDSRG